MPMVTSTSQEKSLGSMTKKIRLFLKLTRQEIADLTGVSIHEIELFEQNLPVPLDVKRKLLKELFARKFNNS